jgi:hypothetical protein
LTELKPEKSKLKQGVKALEKRGEKSKKKTEL